MSSSPPPRSLPGMNDCQRSALPAEQNFKQVSWTGSRSQTPDEQITAPRKGAQSRLSQRVILFVP